MRLFPMRWIAFCVLLAMALASSACSRPAIPTEQLGNVVYKLPAVYDSNQDYLIPGLGDPPPSTDPMDL